MMQYVADIDHIERAVGIGQIFGRHGQQLDLDIGFKGPRARHGQHVRADIESAHHGAQFCGNNGIKPFTAAGNQQSFARNVFPAERRMRSPVVVPPFDLLPAQYFIGGRCIPQLGRMVGVVLDLPGLACGECYHEGNEPELPFWLGSGPYPPKGSVSRVRSTTLTVF